MRDSVDAHVDIFRIPFGSGGLTARFTGNPRRTDGEIAIDVGGVKGTILTEITREELDEWQLVLDTLDGGREARWRSEEDIPAISFHFADWGKWRVDFITADFSLTFTTPLADDWFDVSYRQIEVVLDVLEAG